MDTVRELVNEINSTRTQTSASAKDEVSNIKWIPISNTSDYEWAFNHPSLITEIYNSVITNN